MDARLSASIHKTSRWEQGSVVIGGSGFLGRYAVEALALDDWRVRGCRSRLRQGYPHSSCELGGSEGITFRQPGLNLAVVWAGSIYPYHCGSRRFDRDEASAIGLRPFTADDIRLGDTDNVVGELAQAGGRTLVWLGIEHPHATFSIVPEYLERFHPRGQLRTTARFHVDFGTLAPEEEEVWPWVEEWGSKPTRNG